MKKTSSKNIRPTKLQPQLFSLVKYLSNHEDYRIVVNRENEPLCVMVNYNLWKNADEPYQYRDDETLMKSMKAYYRRLPKVDQEWNTTGISDGFSDED